MEIFGVMSIIALHNQVPHCETETFGDFGCVLHPPSGGSQLCPPCSTLSASFT